MFRILNDAFMGPAQAREVHRQTRQQNPGILLGVRQLQSLCPADGTGDPEAPIFLLSAGWRSGSTLVQRLIMSDHRVLIWGEPYDECGLIQSLAWSMKGFRPDWPPQEYFYDGTPPDQLSGEWIANLFPSLEDWRKGQRALFDAMFAEPAKRAGAVRWGIKEVRLTSEHAFYLRWLYPNAHFVLLYRNPLDAYRSYCRYGRNWYDTFPDKPVFTPKAFGRRWHTLVDGYLRDAMALGALTLRYEDLVSERISIKSLEAHLGVSIDRSVLKTRIGSSERKGEKMDVSALEKWLLKRAVDPIAKQLGYKW